MILKRSFLLTLLLCYPTLVFAANVKELASNISSKTTYQEAASAYEEAVNTVVAEYKEKGVSEDVIETQTNLAKNDIEEALTGEPVPTETEDTPDEESDDNDADETDTTNQEETQSSNSTKGNVFEDTRTDAEKKKALEDKQKAYADAKATEQSKENKALTAATTAATGLGGMELAMGLSEQKADKEAEQDMEAYIQTFRCTYAGKQVKASSDEVELPGGNDETLQKYKTEYMELAADLKLRKEALGMKPGIESETILDKTTMGLYNDENVGITGGTYGSLYRAKALGSEADQAKLDADKKEAKNRMIAGGVMVGGGVLGGLLGDSLMNGKLGDLIKQNKEAKISTKATQAALKIEQDALKSLQDCLKKAGVKNSSKLAFDSFPASILSTKDINCKEDLATLNGDKAAKDVEAQSLFADSADAETILNKLITSFGPEITGKMIGVDIEDFDPVDDEDHREQAIKQINDSLEAVTQRLNDAQEEDAATTETDDEDDGSSSGMLGGITNMLGGSGGSGALSGILGGGGDGGGIAGGAVNALKSKFLGG